MARLKTKAVSPKYVLREFSGENHGMVATRDLLAFNLREGNIRARASHVWVSTEVSLKAAWKKEPPRADLTPAGEPQPKRRITTVEWWKSTNWAVDKENWRINKGRFFITTSEDPPRRLMIKGIQFNLKDVRDCLSAASLSEKRPAGRKSDKDQWRAFWHEVIRLIQNGSEDFGLLHGEMYRSDAKMAEQIGKDLIGKSSEDVRASELTDGIIDRLPFAIGYDAVHQEVKALRRKFALSKRRSAKNIG